MSLVHHANCRIFPRGVPRWFCPFLLERLAMWPRGHISNRMRSASFGLRLLRQCERPCCTLAVVGGCTLFMVGAILAYDPARGFLARRGEPGGGTCVVGLSLGPLPLDWLCEACRSPPIPAFPIGRAIRSRCRKFRSPLCGQGRRSTTSGNAWEEGAAIRDLV